MKLIVQSRSKPGETLSALLTIANGTVTQVRIAVAYITRSGCEVLFPRLSSRIGTDTWNRIPKSVITCFDYGITEPEALEYLVNIPNCSVHIANPQILDRAGLLPTESFHPKFYIFDTADGQTLVVGSSNLTQHALTVNTEIVLVTNNGIALADTEQSWEQLLQPTVALDAALIQRYRTVRRAAPPRSAPDEPPFPIAVAPTVNQTIFYNAVEMGALQPQLFDNLWIEAGSMSSGGSRNQLELPRGANLFFGFNFNNYGHEHETIGHPELIANDQSWHNRPLTWHGDNGMERINLPTLTQGGFDYRNTAILFRRQTDSFQIQVAPWDDPVASAWRQAAQDAGRVYKLGARSSRLCGVF